MESRRTIVLVLRSGGDFQMRDVELIARHINAKWISPVKPRIICLYDKASVAYNLGNFEIVPFKSDLPGTWSRIHLYGPEMEQYRPFLYVDLDTIVVQSLENIFDLVVDQNMFITLEDFWQKGLLATGLVWFPKNNANVKKVYKTFNKELTRSPRMDTFLRKVIKPDAFWQELTDTIYDFKIRNGQLLSVLPSKANLVCFHGKPRIFTVAEASLSISWVKEYVYQKFEKRIPKVTVIIPYKVDRGWLKDAILSVPDGVQLITSQGEGNWPENFNKVLHEATGDYIRYLHEDDMLTENCIEDSINAINEQGVDFIHGEAIELYEPSGKRKQYKSENPFPSWGNLMRKNTIHSATVMYRKEMFEQLGGFDETLNNQEEYEFNLRALKAGFKLGYVEKPLAIYRRHPKQKIRTITKNEILLEKQLVNNKYQ
jgi:hypothetical protein